MAYTFLLFVFCYFVIWWAIKFSFVSDALKTCSMYIYFVTADNWIRVLPVILASKSLWYRSICIYEIIYVSDVFPLCHGFCIPYSCEQPSLIKNYFEQSQLWDVSWHFSIFLSSEALIATDNETLKWRYYRELIDLMSGAFGHNAFSEIGCGCLWKERFNSVTEKDHFFSKSSVLQWCLLEIYTFDGSWKHWAGIIIPVGKKQGIKVMN